MANADLDVVIRHLAKQQIKVSWPRQKAARWMHQPRRQGEGQGDQGKVQADRQEHHAARRCRRQAAATSSDNAADSYARSMRNAAEASPPGRPSRPRPDLSPIRATNSSRSRHGRPSQSSLRRLRELVCDAGDDARANDARTRLMLQQHCLPRPEIQPVADAKRFNDRF